MSQEGQRGTSERESLGDWARIDSKKTDVLDGVLRAGESTAYDQSCQAGDLEFTCEPEALICIGTALRYHRDARSEFRFDGLRDPDRPVGQPSKSR